MAGEEGGGGGGAMTAVKAVSQYFKPMPRVPGYDYLLGLRGLLTIEAFVWVFLQTFVPVAVKDAANDNGPTNQLFLRKTLSVLFWNETLLYSAFILLSARTICLPFMKDPSSSLIASTIFRRSAQLLLPLVVSLAIITLVFAKLGTSYIDDFREQTGNISFETPTQLSSPLVFFNSVFNLFWTTANFATQAGSTAFPSQTLWIVNVIYSQSFTIYMTMVIIPHTRPVWRLEAYPVFILTAWWVQSWAWYSITGLFLADAVTNMSFRDRSARGIPLPFVRRFRLPSYILYLVLGAAGFTLQYLWTDWQPQYENYELEGHTGLYYTAGLNTQYDVRQPQARDDNYLALLGVFLLLETSPFVQKLFANPVFVFLGRRSYSYFLTQSLLIYTLGIKLFTRLNKDETSPTAFSGHVVATFVSCWAATMLAAEAMHWCVDLPGRRLANTLWEWLKT